MKQLILLPILDNINASLVPQGQPKANYLQGLSIIGVQQIDRVVEVVEETLKGKFTCALLLHSNVLNILRSRRPFSSTFGYEKGCRKEENRRGIVAIT